jgi:hypothetical protein
LAKTIPERKMDKPHPANILFWHIMCICKEIVGSWKSDHLKKKEPENAMSDVMSNVI